MCQATWQCQYFGRSVTSRMVSRAAKHSAACHLSPKIQVGGPMEPVTGVFQSAEAARRAAIELRNAGLRPDDLNLLFPGSSEERIHSLPTSDTEQPGVGAAIGGVVGAALGAAGGFELGTAATALIPGVGPVLAVGIAAAALFGAGGL